MSDSEEEKVNQKKPKNLEVLAGVKDTGRLG